ncbi:hypothetical protein GCM10019815_17590 [Pediococcus damnosus]|nr:hypothetical protein PDA01_02440 [Pediococcus damnosus]
MIPGTAIKKFSPSKLGKLPSSGSLGLERGGHDLKPSRSLVFKLDLYLNDKSLR